MSVDVDKWIISPPGVFCASLHGECRHSDSLANATRLIDRFRRQTLNGILLDYRDSTLCHDEDEYAQLAHLFGQGLPRALPFAYVYNRNQLGHVLFMTRTLTENGLRARAFNRMDDAQEWVIQLASQRQAAFGMADHELQVAV